MALSTSYRASAPSRCMRGCSVRATPLAPAKLVPRRQTVQQQCAVTQTVVTVRSGSEQQAASAQAVQSPKAELPLLNTESFYPFLKDAGDTLVVVDFYTDWCGPCKMIYPELVNMSNEMTNVKFAKFNCNKENKELGKSLGIKVAPTFHIYKNSEKVAEMTGAKVDKLRALIAEKLAS